MHYAKLLFLRCIALRIYFFHVTERDEYVPDREGIEQPDLAAVEKAAIEGASALIAEAVKKGIRDYQGRIEVDDERGEQVFALTFACPIQIEVVPAPDRIG